MRLYLNYYNETVSLFVEDDLGRSSSTLIEGR